MSAETTTRQLLVAADLLDRGGLIDRLSCALTVAAVVILLLSGKFLATVAIAAVSLVALVGVVELYLAIRVGFDAALFHRLAAEAKTGQLDLAAFDHAMAGLGLMSAAKADRAVESRVAGARRLLAWQGASLLAQVGLAMTASIAPLLTQ